MHSERQAEDDFFARSIKAYYDSPDVPGVYAARSHLLEAERFILTYLADELRGRSLLDIGVGPVRTIPHFRATCGRVHHLHLHLRRHQQRGQGYAVASDGYFDDGLLTYYGAREEQRQQLAETGFSRLQEVA